MKETRLIARLFSQTNQVNSENAFFTLLFYRHLFQKSTSKSDYVCYYFDVFKTIHRFPGENWGEGVKPCRSFLNTQKLKDNP